MLDQAWFGWISHNNRIEYIRERVHLNLDLNSGEKYIIWLEIFSLYFLPFPFFHHQEWSLTCKRSMWQAGMPVNCNCRIICHRRNKWLYLLKVHLYLHIVIMEWGKYRLCACGRTLALLLLQCMEDVCRECLVAWRGRSRPLQHLINKQ